MPKISLLFRIFPIPPATDGRRFPVWINRYAGLSESSVKAPPEDRENGFVALQGDFAYQSALGSPIF